MATVHGTTTEAFQALKQILQKNLDNGDEIGAAIYVSLDGKPVVDLWGGFADEKRTRPWTEDTIVNVWSTTKTVTSLAALILVDRGLLDLDAPVAKYWPEFAANGKEKILVRHVLSHTSGVSGWDQPFQYSDIYDLENSTARLAAQAPWWEPGTASGYHAVNYGHLVGEIVRRVSGKSLREFIKDEIARPLNADFSLGAPASEWHRVAEIIPPAPMDPAAFAKLDPQSVAVKTLSQGIDSGTLPNTSEFRRAEIGAVNGTTNAKALGLQADGTDLVAFVPARWGIGFGLSHPATTPYIPEGRVFFWFGWGGSFVIVDTESKLTITYVMNKMGEGIIGSPLSKEYIEAVYEIVKGLK
ncbi:beta-lactamase [Talaromyces stipitatus ATCC 10500]|uniref:Beta-lactamase n=1 Tax=Talaromyces stipitatus (strain ATCC 10500 / CBS 375.48 / QM 6759 / NRRL 1006) TaxID=441959 RepID=B8MHS6_TALSN|nr:beta-lactamase [Talaromyces stipitatus ATCC 10500]XP_002483641.1 beta-lactamase [Talaromyces stipitatus ATCC 10500]EED16406.1 beta-lactamase [Talaromyces stipitatus ATCC 10500]EED16407.1 beta-lactamase [Talaromyces stipitatus ATCC 10500]